MSTLRLIVICATVLLALSFFTQAQQVDPGINALTAACTPYHLSGGTAASNNSTSLRGQAAHLCVLTAINTTATLYYLKLYDSSSAPTCSSATNLKHVYPIPFGASSAGNGVHVTTFTPGGEGYKNGIGFCVTGGGGDTDNSNAATGVYIEGSYK